MAITRGGDGGKGARSAKGGGGGAATAAKSGGGGGLGGTSITAAKFESAFNTANKTAPQYKNENFVSLDHFRATLGGTRATQDAAIKAMRLNGKFTLDSHEGLHGKLSQAQKDAAIHEAGSRLVYISRR